MILRHRTSAALAATVLGGALPACANDTAPDDPMSRSAASYEKDGCGLDGMCAASGCEYDPDCCAIADGTCESSCEFDGMSDPDCAPVESGCTLTQGYWKTHYAGWTAWLLTPDLKLPSRLRLKETRRVPMWNGPIECELLQYPAPGKRE